MLHFYQVTSFTKFPFKSWVTQAVKAAHVVHTRASITTWILLTLVDICSKKENEHSPCAFQSSDKTLRRFNFS